MQKKKPIPPNERKLRRKLSEMTGQVREFLARLDAEMMQPSSLARGQRIADLCNRMSLYNDGVRYFWCGVDYRNRKDTPAHWTRGSQLPTVDAVDPHVTDTGNPKRWSANE